MRWVLIKTTNSPMSSADLADELEMREIPFKHADNGLLVPEQEYDYAMDVLMQAETEDE